LPNGSLQAKDVIQSRFPCSPSTNPFLTYSHSHRQISLTVDQGVLNESPSQFPLIAIPHNDGARLPNDQTGGEVITGNAASFSPGDNPSLFKDNISDGPAQSKCQEEPRAAAIRKQKPTKAKRQQNWQSQKIIKDSKVQASKKRPHPDDDEAVMEASQGKRSTRILKVTSKVQDNQSVENERMAEKAKKELRDQRAQLKLNTADAQTGLESSQKRGRGRPKKSTGIIVFIFS
jgi:hypothetical protein